MTSRWNRIGQIAGWLPGWHARPSNAPHRGSSQGIRGDGSGALERSETFCGPLNRYADIYGIRALKSCRARQNACSISPSIGRVFRAIQQRVGDPPSGAVSLIMRSASRSKLVSQPMHVAQRPRASGPPRGTRESVRIAPARRHAPRRAGGNPQFRFSRLGHAPRVARFPIHCSLVACGPPWRGLRRTLRAWRLRTPTRWGWTPAVALPETSALTARQAAHRMERRGGDRGDASRRRP